MSVRRAAGFRHLPCCALASQIGTEKPPETMSVRCCALASQVGTEKPPETMSVRRAGLHSTSLCCALASQLGTEKSPETRSVRCAGLVSSTFPCCALASQVDTEKPPETMSVRCAGAGFPHRTLASQVGTEKSPETRSVRCAGLVSSTFPCCALASQVDTEKPPETMSVRCAGAGFPHRTLASQVGTEKPPETMSVRCAFQIGLRYGAGFLHHLSLLRCGIPSRYGEGSNHVGTVRRAGFLHLSLLNFGVLSPCGEVPRNHVGTVCCSNWAAVRGWLPPPRFGVPSRYGEASRNHVGTLGCGTGLWLPPPLLAALWHPKSEKPPETMSARCAVQILLRYGVGFRFPSRYGEVSRSYMSAQVLCLNVAKHDFSARAAKEPTRSWSQGSWPIAPM